MFGVNWNNFRFIFFNSLLIKLQPQIIDSLLAKRIFFVNLIICNVGFKPAIPEIDEITISLFFLVLRY